MRVDFAERKRVEDEDRAIRLGRLATDHNSQLSEMDRQHGLRLAQIAEQEAKELKEHDDAYDLQLLALGVHTSKLEAEQKRHYAEAERLYAEHLAAEKKLFDGFMQGPAPLNPFIPPGQFPNLGGGTPTTPTPPPTAGASSMLSNGGAGLNAPTAATSSMSNSRSLSVTLGSGAVQVFAAPGQNPEQIAAAVDARLATILRNAVPGGYFQ